jgi:hypothetical protein
VRRADNLTTFMCRLSINFGASTSWNPKGLSRPVAGNLYLLLTKTHICLNVWNIVNIAWSGMLKDCNPSIVVVDGPPKFIVYLHGFIDLLAKAQA